MTIPPVSFVPPVLWVENGYILLPKTTAPLVVVVGGPLSQVQLLLGSIISSLTLPLQGSRASCQTQGLIFLDSAHTLETVSLLNSPQSPIWDFHLFSIGTLTNTILDTL